jgi:hypothetical protein
LSLFLLAVVSPFLLVNGIPQFSAVKWQMAIPACVFDALGLLALNSLLIERTGGKRVRYSDRGAGRHPSHVLGRVGRRIDAKVCDRLGCRSDSSIPAPLIKNTSTRSANLGGTVGPRHGLEISRRARI